MNLKSDTQFRSSIIVQLFISVVLIFFNLEVKGQCNAPSSANSPSTTAGTSVTLSVTSFGSSTQHKWYTASSGGSGISTTTQFAGNGGAWVSQLTASFSQTTTYYVSSYCSATNSETSRYPVTVTITGGTTNPTTPTASIGYTGSPCSGSTIRFYLSLEKNGNTCITPTWSANNGGSVTPVPGEPLQADITWPASSTNIGVTVSASLSCSPIAISNLPVQRSMTLGYMQSPTVGLALSGQTSVCENNTSTSITYNTTALDLNNYAASYIYYFNGGVVFSTSNAAVVNTYTYTTPANLPPGTYTASVTMGFSHIPCLANNVGSSTASQSFTVEPKSSYSVSITGPNEVCDSDTPSKYIASVTNSVGKKSYEWFVNGSKVLAASPDNKEVVLSVSYNSTVYCKVYSDYYCVVSPPISNIITVKYNTPPVADAGQDQDIGLPRTSFTLWGAGSDNCSLTSFSWTKISGPTVTLGNATTSALVLSDINAGTYVFRLTVTDNYGKTATDDVTVTAAILSNNYNYAKEEVVFIPGQTTTAQVSSLTVNDKSVSINYFDDLGKKAQTIQYQATPGKKDLIVPYSYDALGRSPNSFLPIASLQSSGNFSASVLNSSYTASDHYKFYNDIAPFNDPNGLIANDGQAYTTQTYELSPLGRPVTAIGQGASWAGADKKVTTFYGTNTASDIRIFTITNGLLTGNSTWAANLLSVETNTDEENVQSQVITNREGLKLVTRSKIDAANWAQTYYVYDTRNQLRFVLPPELIRIIGSGNPTQKQIDTWAYQYTYDELGRQVESKGPGKATLDWDYTVYDSRNRVVLSQDPKQRLSNEWSYTKYDEFNRPVVSGIYRPGSAIIRAAMQANVNALSSNAGYQNVDGTVNLLTDIAVNAYTGKNQYSSTNSIVLEPGFTFKTGVTGTNFSATIETAAESFAAVFPTSNEEPLVITYYDNYNLCDFCQNAPYQFVAETFGTSSNEPFQKSDRIKGQAVAGSVKIIGSSPAKWLNSVTYYNRHGQAIQSIGDDHLGGRHRTSTLVDFSGTTLAAVSTYSGLSIPVSTVKRTFEYDHVGRLLKLNHQINTQPVVTLVANEYNEAGQLVDKKIHSVAGSPYLQSIDYRYGIRGQMTKINSMTGTDSGDPNDYFSMELGYENFLASNGAIQVNLNSKRYDGMVSGLRWRNDLTAKEQGFAYTYNNLGWLNSSTFKFNSNNGWGSQAGFFNEDAIDYDYNGNIQLLNRKQKTSAASAPVIDQLQYKYTAGTGTDSGNKLFRVTDSAPEADKAKGFKDGVNSDDDYAYDINGNMIRDKNKDITVTYNLLNLTDRVTFSDNSYIQYVYDAGGAKLSQSLYNPASQLQSKTDYVGGLVLLDGLVQFLLHEEGRALLPDNNNLVAAPAREANSLEGFTANQDVTLSSEYVAAGEQTYVKVVANQASGTPGVYPIGNTYNVNEGESYSLKVLGYQSVSNTASLIVASASGTAILWPGTTLPQGAANENYVTSTFTIPAGVTQIKIGVEWNGAAVGDAFFLNQVKLYKTDFEYQYFLTDQVGSPRVVLQTTPATLTYTATMESENFSTENISWLNLNNSRYTIAPNALAANATPGGNQSIMMDNTYKVGPARSMKVFPGDIVNANVSSYWGTASGFNPAVTGAMSAAVSALLSGGVSVVDGAISGAYATTGNSVIALAPFQGSSQPSAFINYILFDENYVVLEAKSTPVGATANVRAQIALPQIDIKETGYLFVYLSYDNNNTIPVYFDDLKIIYQESAVVQVNNYYAYGMVATEWVRDGETENNYLFQGKELNDKTGLQDFGARMYAGDLGRWFAGDPMNQFSSPYVAMGNNSVMSTDPDGRWVNFVIGAVLGGVSGFATGKQAGKHGWDLFGYTAAGAGIGALSGGAAAGVSAAGGSAMVAGAAAGSVAGAGFAGLQSNWNGAAMMKGGLIGGASGFVGGGFASAIGGGGGAFVGGVTSDLTSQVLSTGHVNLLQAGVGGAASFGMYHAASFAQWRWKGGDKFGEISLKYKEFTTIQAENQRARFWGKEHGVTLLHEGSPKIVEKKYRFKNRVDFPSPDEMGVELENIKAQWHSHWSNDHLTGFSPDDLSHPYNQMVTNRFSSHVNYNHIDSDYNSIISKINDPVRDYFLRSFIFPNLPKF